MVSIVTGIIGILAALVIVLLIRKDRLHVNHGLSWLLVGIVFALLGFAPGIFDEIVRHLSIAYPPVLALTLGVVVLAIKLLLIDIERSQLEMRNQRLVQRVVMLEADLRALSDKLEEKPVN